MQQKALFHRLTLLLLSEDFNPVNLTNVFLLWNLFVLGAQTEH